MPKIVQVIYLSLTCYLGGSILMAHILSWCGLIRNPCKEGSNNPGATNVFRQSKALGALTGLFDFLKAFLPLILLIKYSLINSNLLPIMGICIVLGHVFPFYAPFKGGKGVATSLGVIVALTPITAVACILSFSLTLIILRKTGIASVYSCLFGYLFHVIYFGDHNLLYAILICIVIYRHHKNLSDYFYLPKNPTAT